MNKTLLVVLVLAGACCVLAMEVGLIPWHGTPRPRKTTEAPAAVKPWRDPSVMPLVVAAPSAKRPNRQDPYFEGDLLICGKRAYRVGPAEGRSRVYRSGKFLLWSQMGRPEGYSDRQLSQRFVVRAFEFSSAEAFRGTKQGLGIMDIRPGKGPFSSPDGKLLVFTSEQTLQPRRALTNPRSPATPVICQTSRGFVILGYDGAFRDVDVQQLASGYVVTIRYSDAAGHARSDSYRVYHSARSVHGLAAEPVSPAGQVPAQRPVVRSRDPRFVGHWLVHGSFRAIAGHSFKSNLCYSHGLYFWEEESGPGRLGNSRCAVVARRAGAGLEVVYDSPELLCGPAISADGNCVAFATRKQGTSILLTWVKGRPGAHRLPCLVSGIKVLGNGPYTARVLDFDERFAPKTQDLQVRTDQTDDELASFDPYLKIKPSKLPPPPGWYNKREFAKVAMVPPRQRTSTPRAVGDGLIVGPRAYGNAPEPWLEWVRRRVPVYQIDNRYYWTMHDSYHDCYHCETYGASATRAEPFRGCLTASPDRNCFAYANMEDRMEERCISVSVGGRRSALNIPVDIWVDHITVAGRPGGYWLGVSQDDGPCAVVAVSSSRDGF